MNYYVDLKRRIGIFLAMCGVWEYISDGELLFEGL